ncbi:alpha/beta hydrolase [Bacillus sp. A116_S68]|nr:alpha/beta hydrolase [Bacillus sp. A116_S68]
MLKLTSFFTYIYLASFIMIVLYVSYLTVFYFTQDDMLFQSPTFSDNDIASIEKNEHYEEIRINVEDNLSLHGWLLHQKDAPSPAPLLIYFGGNAEVASQSIDDFEVLSEWNVLFVNYRGYGLSDGEPSEETLFHDAEVIYDVVKERSDVKEDQIVIMGRSMGSAPATHVSKQRDVAGTILVSPYDNRKRLIKHRYPLLPFTSLIRHPFENSDKAPFIMSPVLGFIASEDKVIPPDHSEKTLGSWGGPNRTIWIDGYGHNDLQTTDSYWEGIQTFLNEL